MKTHTQITWEETKPLRISMSVQTEDWRLECNANTTDMECQKILTACSTDTMLQILRQAISLHLPTWEAALKSADPPDNQLKKVQTGYL